MLKTTTRKETEMAKSGTSWRDERDHEWRERLPYAVDATWADIAATRG